MANRHQIEQGKSARAQIAQLFQDNHAVTVTVLERVFKENGLNPLTARNIIPTFSPTTLGFEDEFHIPIKEVEHRKVRIWLRADVPEERTDLQTLIEQIDQTLDVQKQLERTHRASLLRIQLRPKLSRKNHQRSPIIF